MTQEGLERQPRPLMVQGKCEPGSLFVCHTLSPGYSLGLHSLFPYAYMQIRMWGWWEPYQINSDCSSYFRQTFLKIPWCMRTSCQKTKGSDNSSIAQTQEWFTAAKTGASLYPKHKEVYMLTLIPEPTRGTQPFLKTTNRYPPYAPSAGKHCGHDLCRGLLRAAFIGLMICLWSPAGRVVVVTMMTLSMSSRIPSVTSDMYVWQGCGRSNAW